MQPYIYLILVGVGTAYGQFVNGRRLEPPVAEKCANSKSIFILLWLLMFAIDLIINNSCKFIQRIEILIQGTAANANLIKK